MILLHYENPGWYGFVQRDPCPEEMAELMAKLQQFIVMLKTALREMKEPNLNLEFSVHHYCGLMGASMSANFADVVVEVVVENSRTLTERISGRIESSFGKRVIASEQLQIPNSDWNHTDICATSKMVAGRLISKCK